MIRCGVKRGSIKSDRILGFVSSNSVWRRSIMGCMELHGFSFELCIGMGMAARIDEGRWQVGERRIGSGWQGRFWRSFWKKQQTSEGKRSEGCFKEDKLGSVRKTTDSKDRYQTAERATILEEERQKNRLKKKSVV